MAVFRLACLLVVAIATLVCQIAAAPSAIRLQIDDLHRRGVTEPKDDPFYTPPAGFETAAPGTVLKDRKVTAAILGLLSDPVDTYQLLYRTSSSNGSAIATVTTVFVPLFAQKDKFVSFQTAEDSGSQQCAPSFTYQLGAEQTNAIVSAEFLEIQAYLASGYIVASPDYEGPDSAFAPGRFEGASVLDNIRAVTNFGPKFGLTTAKPAVVAVGYSGGAIATGWAASLQPKLAPELNIKGWSLGGTPANLTGTAQNIDGTIWVGFLAAAISGLLKPSTYLARIQPVYDRIITPTGRAAIEYAGSHCATDDLTHFAGQKVQSTKFQTLGDQLFYEPTIQAVLQENIMAVNKDETPTAPVYMSHSVNDEVIPYANASAAAQRWCDFGGNIHFNTLTHGGHLTTAVFILPSVLGFASDAFAGKVAKGCTRSTLPAKPFDALTLGLDLEPILTNLLSALARLGNEDQLVKQDISNFGQTF